MTPKPPSLRPSGWWAALPLLLALLVSLPFVLFWPVTVGQRTFSFHDLQYYFLPYHKLVADLLARGEAPLWNPYTLGGMPLWGDIQTALFYPPNWLFLALPPAHAMSLGIVLHYAVAGVGMFLFLRRLRLGLLPVAVGAFIFMFNGFLVVRVVHVMLLAGAALVPWLFWALEGVLARKTWRPIVGMGVLVGLQLLAGHAQIPIYTAIGLGVYTLVIVGRTGWRTRDLRAAWPLVDLGVVYLIALGIGAIQYLPWLEISTLSLRAAGVSYDYAIQFSLAGADWLLFLFPYAYSGLQTTWPQALPATGQGYAIWERVGYVGILPLALAVLGLLEVWRRPGASAPADGGASVFQVDRLWGLAAALVVALLIAAAPATPVGRLLYVTPLLGSIRAHARALSLATFALAALAAFGVQRLARRTAHDPPDRAAVAVGVLLLGLVGAVLVVVRWLNNGGQPDVSQDPWYRATVGAALVLPQANALWPLLLAAATAGFLIWARRGLTPVKSAALVALVAVDVLSFALTFNPTIDTAVFDRVPPSVEFLRRDPTLFRIAPFLATDRLPPETAQDQLAVSWAVFYGMEDIGGFNPLQTRRYTDLLYSRDAEEASYGFLRYDLMWPAREHLLDLFNVKYVLIASDAPAIPPDGWPPVYTDANVTIYQNPRPMDRAVFADQVRVEPNATAILDRVQQPDFDPRREAWLEEWRDATPLASLASGGPAEATVERVGANEMLIHTRTDGERLLVLSEMWFPGWHAEVVEGDGPVGQPLTVQRVNSLFRGLVVPPGENTIRMTYRPTTVPLGIGLTVLTLAACGLAWLWAGRRATRRDRRLAQIGDWRVEA